MGHPQMNKSQSPMLLNGDVASACRGGMPVGGPEISGVASGCPYCLAKQNLWPEVGTSLIFLKGFDSGYWGEVVADKWNVCSRNQILVHMEYERASTACRFVTPGRDLYVSARLYSVPDWMPPYSIDDNWAVHESLVDSMPQIVIGTHASALAPEQLSRTIIACWRRRLPLQGSELWPMLEAHGVPSRQKERLLQMFEFGTKILGHANGRRPVKRKRMQPMSLGRYLTRTEEELNISLFGRR